MLCVLCSVEYVKKNFIKKVLLKLYIKKSRNNQVLLRDTFQECENILCMNTVVKAIVVILA